MYYRDHSPPHFHAIYGEYEVLLKVDDFSILKGQMPNRALKMIKEWASIHKTELEEAWQAVNNLQAPEIIPPLD